MYWCTGEEIKESQHILITLYLKMIKLKFNNQYYHMRIVIVK